MVLDVMPIIWDMLTSNWQVETKSQKCLNMLELGEMEMQERHKMMIK